MFLLVGASVRALMESAVESGYPVMGIDFFGDLDSRRCGKTLGLVSDLGLEPTVRNLLHVAQGTNCQGLVYASGPENHSDELSFWEERGLLCGNRISVVKQVRDPWQLRQALTEIGVSMPAFYSVGCWNPDEAVAGERGWLLKPLNRGGGHGITELPRDKKAALARLSALTNPGDYIVEEYISGVPASVTFLADGDQAVVLGTSRQLTGIKGLNKQPFVYAGNIVPLDSSLWPELRTLDADLLRISRHLTSVFGLKGLNTLDFIVNSAGIWVLELNPRWSASVELIEKWRGERLFSLHIAACIGKGQTDIPFGTESYRTFKQSFAGFWGKSIVYAQSSFEIRKQAYSDIDLLYERGVRDIPLVGTKIEKGQPICTVLSEADSDAACWQSLQRKAEWARRIFGDAESSAAY